MVTGALSHPTPQNPSLYQAIPPVHGHNLCQHPVTDPLAEARHPASQQECRPIAVKLSVTSAAVSKCTC